MSYEKLNLKDGDKWSASHVAHLEAGISEAMSASGGGLDDTAKVLLVNILRNAVFSTNQASNISALEAAFGFGGGGGTTSTYAIINNLTNVTTNNTASSVAANGSYGATLTAADGCTMQSVVVTMGGADITASAYTDGKINIPAVTGIVIITAVAEGASVAAYVQDGLIHEFSNLSAEKIISGGQSIFNSGADFTVFVAAKKTDTMKNYAHNWIGYGSSNNLEFFFRRNWNNQISLTAAEADDSSLSNDNNKTWKCPDGVDVDGMIYAWVVKSGSTITAYCNDIKLGTIAQENAKIFDGDLKINNSKYPTPKVLIYNRALSADECTQNYNSMIAEVGA